MEGSGGRGTGTGRKAWNALFDGVMRMVVRQVSSKWGREAVGCDVHGGVIGGFPKSKLHTQIWPRGTHF